MMVGKTRGVIFFFLIVINLIVVDCHEEKELIVVDPVVAAKWELAAQDFDDIIWPQRNVLMRELSLTLNRIKEKRLTTISKPCQQSLSALLIGLQLRRLWAYKLLDSSARGHAGMAYGYTSDLGHHDQCLSIEVDEQFELESGSQLRTRFTGRYCLANLIFPPTRKLDKNWLKPLKLDLSQTKLKSTLYEFYGNNSEYFHHNSFAFAICIPSSCSRDDLNYILQDKMAGKELKVEIRKHCEVAEDIVPFVIRQPSDQLIALVILMALISLVAVSTVYTTMVDNSTFLQHFCVIRNTIKLSTDYHEPYMQRMRFLDCFKFWYHTGGCFAHLVGFGPVVPLVYGLLNDLSDVMEEQWWVSEYAKKAIYTTQVIFLLSGFFSCYYIIPIIKRSEGKMPFIPYVFKRWLRTAPTTLGVVILMFAVSTFWRGPLSQELIDKHLGNCRTGWILTALYINNYQPFNEICIPQTWSQSADFHLWILSYFPLIWLIKKPKLGVASCLAMIGVGAILPALTMFYYDLPSHTSGRPIDMLHSMILGNYFPMMHLGTHNNISAYFIGILMGYCCAENIRPSKNFTIFIWGLGGWVVTISSIFLPYVFTTFLGFEVTRFWDVVYAGCFRILYLAGWVGTFYYYANCKGYNKFTDFLMAGQHYVILGRLAFSVYLTQMLPMAFYFTQTYEYVPINRYYMMIRFLSIIVICWAAGYVAFLMFEAPFISISKKYFTKSLNADTIKSTSVVKPQLDPNQNLDKKKL